MYERSVYTDKLHLVRPEAIYNANLCLCSIPSVNNYAKLACYLHPEEQKYYSTLVFERRIRSYLFGRYVAKKAVADFSGEENLNEICIQSGIFTQPVVVSGKGNVQVSISHCNNLAAALAFPEVHPLAIDIEQIDHDKHGALQSQLSLAEQGLAKSCLPSYENALTLLWTAKEALSKVLKTGLMTPFLLFEISKIERHEHYVECLYRNFAQYKSFSFFAGDCICSIVHPMKTEIRFDRNELFERMRDI